MMSSFLATAVMMTRCGRPTLRWRSANDLSLVLCRRHYCFEHHPPYPTDARVCERARAQLVDLLQEANIKLRQSYARGSYCTHAPRLPWTCSGH
jgi:hypothetical protein